MRRRWCLYRAWRLAWTGQCLQRLGRDLGMPASCVVRSLGAWQPRRGSAAPPTAQLKQKSSAAATYGGEARCSTCMLYSSLFFTFMICVFIRLS